MTVGRGVWEGNYSFTSRFEEGPGTNPEELIGAAHAGCFSMAFAGDLAAAGYAPGQIHTTVKVTVEKVGAGFGITRIELDCDAQVPDIGEDDFQRIADGAKTGCPVSRALASVPEIILRARLV